MGNYSLITQIINKKNKYSRYFIVLIAILILALNYNLFLVPNNLVTGGTSGIAIILKKIFNITPVLFIYIASSLLVLLSLMVQSIEKTARITIGAMLFPIFITITSPICEILSKYIVLNDMLIVSLVTGVICGVANGLIFKTGYTTGGTDIVMRLINKYLKIPESRALFLSNILIIIWGAFVFGISHFIYSIIILTINTIMIDKILIGKSNSKLFFIHTKQTKKVKDFIINDLKTGVTIFKAKGGFTKKDNNVIMCVVQTKDYYRFKETVLEIDPKAFFVINDCYEVTKGAIKK